MKIKSYIPALALALLATAASCQKDTETVDNAIFAPGLQNVTTINVKPTTETYTGTVSATLAKAEAHEVKVKFSADADKVKEYNALYSADYEMLPRECYTIPEPVAGIPAGGDSTGDVKVEFSNLNTLDLDKTYVLPVVMSSEFGSLTNNTFWFVVKEAALVSTVPDMTENFGVFNLGYQAPELQSIKEITVEALIYPFDFPNMLATLMGVEGKFLIRIGDAGLPPNQIQLATASGNVTDPAWSLDTKRWTFVTLTYNTTNGECKVYFNGVQKGATQPGTYRSPVNWNTAAGDINDGARGFYVGYAYSPDRYFNGYMSELRVWNRILTKEEINAPFHFYTIDPDSEGLVSYWKMDEGAGTTIHDYANGYDLKLDKAPDWIPVSLPEK